MRYRSPPKCIADVDAGQDKSGFVPAALGKADERGISLKYLHLLAWMVGGAGIFGLIFILAFEPVCSGLFPGQAQEIGAWRFRFFGEGPVGHFMIAYFIYGLAVVGILHASERAHEVRMLHRARVSVLPKGVASSISGSEMLACNVAFYNGGNLPATRLCWLIDRKFSMDGHLDDFPIERLLSGSSIVPAKMKVIKGARAIALTELDSFRTGGGAKDRWLYVWGRISYEDGFGRNCRTDFCFRYNLAGMKDKKILVGTARQHEYGNRAE